MEEDRLGERWLHVHEHKVYFRLGAKVVLKIAYFQDVLFFLELFNLSICLMFRTKWNIVKNFKVN